MKKTISTIFLCSILAAGQAAGIEPHYTPDGQSVVTVNGGSKFNRGLYGAHTGFRVDCSDTPEFGIYLPRMGGNLRITLPEGDVTARYTPGKMNYSARGVEVEAQVLRSTDAALWRVTNSNTSAVSLPVRFGGVAEKKFFREGDLGVDAPDCFDLKPEYCTGNIYNLAALPLVNVEYGAKERKNVNLILPLDNVSLTDLPSLEGTLNLAPGETKYLAFFPAGAEAGVARPYVENPVASLAPLLAQAEQERNEIASTFFFTTPDPYLNPVAGAISIAADGIWSGEAWLHGSIGWRTPHLGWRGAYVGDAIGLHDRALKHFRTYAANQITDIPPVVPHPSQDSALNMARAEKRWGTQMYSNGYISRRPGKKDEMSHYDMNMVYIDALLRHFRHTGDTATMREFFPVIALHLDWEKRNFDPDNNHLYDAYCCIWASDALYYSGGDVTHSSAYNYFANKLTAQIAEAIGEDPEPYRAEADAIRAAIDSVLWIEDRGHWAEFRDNPEIGLGRLHPSAALWTIYHSLDSEIANPLQAYAAMSYVDTRIPHIPVADTGYHTLSTTNWKPYAWSINNVAIAEVMHTALAYWQAGRNDDAYKLMKGVMMDNMYYGASPLNFGQISRYDAARGECYRDFADPIGVWSRALTEGLFGVLPDMIGSDPTLTIRPGFPSDWTNASVNLPNAGYIYYVDEKGNISLEIQNRYGKNSRVKLQLPVNLKPTEVKVNGQPTEWSFMENAIGTPMIEINCGTEPKLSVEIIRPEMANASLLLADNEEVLSNESEGNLSCGPISFRHATIGGAPYLKPEVQAAEPLAVPAPNGFDRINPKKCVTVDISEACNSSISDIFNNRYLSPRPSSTTLRIPAQGIGEWCHPKDSAHIDDSGLRAIARAAGGVIKTDSGVPLRLQSDGNNVVYTSLWDNYPDSVTIALPNKKASNAYLLMAGSTNHMQSYIPNARITVSYTDGSSSMLNLVNPYNWAPIEQDFYTDDFAFALPEGILPPMRMSLANGRCSRNLDEIAGLLPSQGDERGLLSADGRRVDCGAATLIDMPLDPDKKVSTITLTTLSNDVVAGLVAVTLQQ